MFSMSFLLECAENFHGQACSTFCQPRDDSSGHFTCDEFGGIVCIVGFTDVNTNCVQCVPTQGCCKLIVTYQGTYPSLILWPLFSL